MTLLNSITNAISSIPVSEKMQRGFLAASKEGRSSIILPESAVTIGRTVAATRRGGFMEFQERLIEEVTGAIVWLWGVEWMRNLFKEVIKTADKPNATGIKKTL